MGLLTNFIQTKIKEYQEPTREGTHKGEPIGLSKKKYAAALSCLTNRRYKELAKEIGVSHGLFLKWRTEEEFTTRREEADQEFRTHFLRIVESQVKKEDFSLDDWLNDAIELYEDIDTYGKLLKYNLRERIKVLYQEIPENDSRRFVYEFFNYALAYRGNRRWDLHWLIIEKQVERGAKLQINAFSDEIPILTERKRNALLEYLKTVRKYHSENVKMILQNKEPVQGRLNFDLRKLI